MNGLVLIDKAGGMTSHDVVDRFRRTSREKKAGHTGTLDPMATGLLIICSGRATKLQSYLMGMEKTYEGEIRFGWATDTYDAEGSPSHPDAANEPIDVTHVDFATALKPFIGEIDQVPPAYSAKKIEGKRAYDLAREGAAPKLEARRVTVYDFQILGVEGSIARFRVRSSAGTYVRSLAHDLGASLGIPAHLASLRRTAIGNFRVEDAVAVDRLREMTPEEIFAKPHFIPLSEIDLPFGRVFIDHLQEQRLRQGQVVVVKPEGGDIKPSQTVVLMNLRDELVALGEAVNVVAQSGVVSIQPKIVL